MCKNATHFFVKLLALCLSWKAAQHLIRDRILCDDTIEDLVCILYVWASVYV